MISLQRKEFSTSGMNLARTCSKLCFHIGKSNDFTFQVSKVQAGIILPLSPQCKTKTSKWTRVEIPSEYCKYFSNSSVSDYIQLMYIQLMVMLHQNHTWSFDLGVFYIYILQSPLFLMMLRTI